jgi:ABC-type branched-subunit amino acid transport system substrate-binding protein
VTGGLHAGACLSLTGRFAQFGIQAANGLRLWADAAGVELTVVDDESDRDVLAERLPALAADADLLFGPYSTVLMRAAIPVAEGAGILLFNHGGSGGRLDVPGRVVNILTPAARYAEPFVAHLAGSGGARLFTTHGKGAFGRDVIAGARTAAVDAGIAVEILDFNTPPDGTWDLISAGVYEDDIAAVRRARALPDPPRFVCSVAAGVASFAGDAGDPDGVFGIGQWAPGAGGAVDVGMGEREFLAAWRTRSFNDPDYPGVQAYAAGVIASEAARAAGSTRADALWEAVAGMDCATMFGRFRLDPDTGVQAGHAGVLTRWRGGMAQVFTEVATGP